MSVPPMSPEALSRMVKPRVKTWDDRRLRYSSDRYTIKAELPDIQEQAANEAAQMERLRSEGKERTATFRRYLGNRMLYQAMLARYREYGLIGEQARQ